MRIKAGEWIMLSSQTKKFILESLAKEKQQLWQATVLR